MLALLRAAACTRMRSRHREDGQTVAEYSLVLGVITITIVATVTALSNSENAAFQSAIGVLDSLTPG